MLSNHLLCSLSFVALDCDYKAQVLLGVHDLDTGIDDTKSVKITIKIEEKDRIIKHPEYSNKTKKYDVALLDLKEDIPFKEKKNIRPVCLPDGSSHDYDIHIDYHWARA